MNLFENKIEEVKNHFLKNDLHLGYRRLVDCVLETQNFDVYKKCIELHEWKELNEADTENFITKSVTFLESLKKYPVAEHKIDTGFLAKINRLEKLYSKGNFKLGAIDMTVCYGEVLGLVGENGNGKTTLLRILAKDLGFDNGSIEFHSEINQLSIYNLRTHLAYIPQRTPKWHGSLKTNLKFAASHYGIKGDENEIFVMMMIIRFGLYAFRNHSWSELSSGYKMRFELARTFLRKPKFLLLDEPLANLDVLAQQIILEDLKYLAKSISNPLGIVLSSQQLFEVEKISDKVIFLKNGSPTILNENANDIITKVVELETEADREQLEIALKSIDLKQINFNGGQYVIEFNDDSLGLNNFLSKLIQHHINIKYVRDISTSSRRFFK